MSLRPPHETRKDREELTKRAVAEVLRARIAEKRLRQTDVARWSGVNRSYVQALLRAEKQVSLCVCLELSHGLGFDDEAEFLRAVIHRRAELRRGKEKDQTES
jgi:plasmid maintenance system antidote protein VapI